MTDPIDPTFLLIEDYNLLPLDETKKEVHYTEGDTHLPVYKFCRVKDGNNIHVLFDPEEM